MSFLLMKHYIIGNLKKIVRSNSSLENYNQYIKHNSDKKRYLSWLNFINFLIDEEKRISDMINLNEKNPLKLNIKVIEEFDLDLSLFYEEFRVPNTTITEIPANRLDVLINKMGIIIQNSKEEKTYSLDIQQIKNFIDITVNKLEKELEII